jgi:hypothetical protein
MAKESLNRLQVAGGVEDALASGVAGTVHLRPRPLAFRDETGALLALVPPVVGAVSTHGLFGELVELHLASAVLVRYAEGNRLPAAEQVVVRLSLHVKDEALEVDPEILVGDG